VRNGVRPLEKIKHAYASKWSGGGLNITPHKY